ncbi:MAG: CoA transferase [Chloroflexi bacterium]|nr:CoA transferase [Chloroflexota bacterium]
MRPLANIRILDLTRLLPGPFCSLMLADLGAEVIKVEDTSLGDYLRWQSPRLAETQSLFFMALNRNKQSLRLNLKPKEGKEVFGKLVQTADVVLESFRPGRLDKLGVGYDAMSAINPRIIYCAISGYGQDGPYKERAGHDLNYIARAGLLDLFGKRGGEPMMPPVQIADLTGAYLAAIGVLSAVVARATTGRGQFVDISMMDGVWPWLLSLLPRYWFDGTAPGRGELHLGGAMPCYNIYECRDGQWISLGALEPQFWVTFCRMVQREDWIARQRDTGPEAEPTFAGLRALFQTKPRAEWLEFFADADVCTEPVLTAREAAGDPQIRHRRMMVEVEQPHVGKIKEIASPLKLSDAPEPRLEPSPEYGQHTGAILRSLGYSDEQIGALKELKVI